jgi:hypothetical protein
LEQVFEAFLVVVTFPHLLEKSFRFRVAIAPCCQRGRREYLALAKRFNVRGEKVQQPDQSNRAVQLGFEIGLGLILSGKVVTIVAPLKPVAENIEVPPAGFLVSFHLLEELGIFPWSVAGKQQIISSA